MMEKVKSFFAEKSVLEIGIELDFFLGLLLNGKLILHAESGRVGNRSQ